MTHSGQASFSSSSFGGAVVLHQVDSCAWESQRNGQEAVHSCGKLYN